MSERKPRRQNEGFPLWFRMTLLILAVPIACIFAWFGQGLAGALVMIAALAIANLPASAATIILAIVKMFRQ